METLRQLWRLYAPFRRKMWVITFVMLCELIIESGIIMSFQTLLDQAITKMNLNNLSGFIGILIFCTIAIKGIAILRTRAYARVMGEIALDIRQKLFERFDRMTVKDYKGLSSGKIMTLFTDDLNGIENITQVAVPVSLVAILGIVISVIMLNLISTPLTILAIVGLCLCVLSPMVVKKRVTYYVETGKNQKEALLHSIDERIGGYREAIAFDLKPMLYSRFSKQAEALYQSNRNAYFFSEIMEILPKMMIDLMNVLIVVIGIQMVVSGLVTAGALLSFNALYAVLSSAVSSLTWSLPSLSASMVSVERLNQFLEQYNHPSPQGGTVSDVMNLDIDFHDVAFGYDKQMVLKSVSHKFGHGKHIAVVGPSGSGKSSILQLLMGFYPANLGNIMVGETSFNTMDLEHYRSQIGLVSQEHYLFNLSIEDNLKLGAPNATTDECIDILKAVGLWDAILAMPEGIKTLIGGPNGGLSGGQKQRLSIARTLLRKPKLLFLDEATSALDPKTEQMIQSYIDDTFKDRTIINVSHRLMQISHYDQILVLEQGHVAEFGDHETLITKNGLYAELFRKQSGFDMSDDMSEVRIDTKRLMDIPLFKSMPEAFLKDLSSKFVTEDYQAGEDIIIEGETGTRFYILVRGNVQIIKADVDGSEIIVNHLEDGDYFGEIALLKPVPRTATVRAKTHCLILSLRRNAFESIVAQSSDIMLMIQKTMEERLKGLAQK